MTINVIIMAWKCFALIMNGNSVAGRHMPQLLVRGDNVVLICRVPFGQKRQRKAEASVTALSFARSGDKSSR